MFLKIALFVSLLASSGALRMNIRKVGMIKINPEMSERKADQEEEDFNEEESIPDDLGQFEKDFITKVEKYKKDTEGKTLPAELRILLAVPSMPHDERVRNVIRRTWMKMPGVCAMGRDPKPQCTVNVVFVVGDTSIAARNRSDIGDARREGDMLYVATHDGSPHKRDFHALTSKMQSFFKYGGNLHGVTHVGRVDQDYFPDFHSSLPAVAKIDSKANPRQFLGRKMLSHNCNVPMEDIEYNVTHNMPRRGGWYCLYGSYFLLSRQLAKDVTGGSREFLGKLWWSVDIDDRDLGRAITKYVEETKNHVEVLYEALAPMNFADFAPSHSEAHGFLGLGERSMDPICESVNLHRNGALASDDAQSGEMLSASHILSLRFAEEDVTITKWANRFGNNLVQLEFALVFAARLGKSKIVLPTTDPANGGCPSCSGHINDVMDLPREIVISEETMRRDTCKAPKPHEMEGEWFHGLRKECEFTITDGAKMLRKYALPHLNKQAKLAMNGDVTDHDLVIHLRSGDAMGQQRNGNHYQPSCNFYKSLIKKGLPDGKAFDKIIVVTEADQRNPCGKVLQRDFPEKVKVQSSSIATDSGTILAARHLIAGRTTFSQELAKMSTRVQQVHIPIGHEWHFQGWTTDCMEHVDSYVYDLKGMEKDAQYQTYGAECDWMVNDAEPLPDPKAPCKNLA